jgi:hypothetical protein
MVEQLEDRSLLSSNVTAAAYGQLPLAFEANQGQAAAGIDFVANGSGSSLSLNSQGAVLTLGQGAGSSVLSLGLAGANPGAQPVGLDPLMTRANYLTGSDPSQWHTDIPTFGRVAYHDVYPGIDVAYYANQGRLEDDFIVAPGANPDLIRMNIQGASSVAIDAAGDWCCTRRRATSSTRHRSSTRLTTASAKPSRGTTPFCPERTRSGFSSAPTTTLGRSSSIRC